MGEDAGVVWPANTTPRECFMAMTAAMKKVLSPSSETRIIIRDEKKASICMCLAKLVSVADDVKDAASACFRRFPPDIHRIIMPVFCMHFCCPSDMRDCFCISYHDLILWWVWSASCWCSLVLSPLHNYAGQNHESIHSLVREKEKFHTGLGKNYIGNSYNLEVGNHTRTACSRDHPATGPFTSISFATCFSRSPRREYFKLQSWCLQQGDLGHAWAHKSSNIYV